MGNNQSQSASKIIDELKNTYDEFVKLGKLAGSDISFSKLYWDDNRGWDAYIKYYFINQELNQDNFVMTHFQTRKGRKKYPEGYNDKISSVIQSAIVKCVSKINSSGTILPPEKLEKPSELMVDLCCFQNNTVEKMKLGLELEQSNKNEQEKLKDILFDFSKLVNIKSEKKIMISFPWKHQQNDLLNKMKQMISKISTKADNDNYLIIFISRTKNKSPNKNGKTENYEISGVILNQNNSYTLEYALENHSFDCLWFS